MPIPLAAMGVQLGADILSNVINNEMQNEQQKRLMQLQIQGQKEMTDYTMAKQLQMWKDTNYPAQVQQMKDAGLSVGLMYGKGGGGGATTGSPSANVSGGVAQKGSVNIAMGMQLAQQQEQIELLKAQKENVNAQTEKTKAEVPNIQADTEVKGAQLNLIAQEYDNKRAQHDILEVDLALKRLEQYVQNNTVDYQIKDFDQQVKIGAAKLRSANAEANVDEQTQETLIKTAKARYVNIVVDNALKAAQTQLAKANIQLTTEEIQLVKKNTQRIYEQNEREWRYLSVAEKEALIKQGYLDLEQDKLPAEYIRAIAGGIGAVSSAFKPPAKVNVQKNYHWSEDINHY